MPHGRKHFLFIWVLSAFLTMLGFAVYAPWVAQAASPIPRTVTVTVTVPGQGAPLTPQLIAPANGAKHNTGLILFQWYAVKDNPIALDHYELSLNNQKVWGDIPLTAHSTDNYTLTTDGTIYSLQVKSAARLSDGHYTWKIRVLDTNDVGTDSTTWSFDTDTVAPPLTVVEVGGTAQNISAGDANTMPQQPIVVSTSNPIIRGRTEALSTVQVIVKYASGLTQTLTATASETGSFDLQIPQLLANQVATLDFTVTDPSGNRTTLTGVPVTYQTSNVVITVPPFFPSQPVITLPLGLVTIEITPRLSPIAGGTELPTPTPRATPQLQTPRASTEPFLPPSTVPVPVAPATRTFLTATNSLIVSSFFFFTYIVLLFWLTGNVLVSFPSFVWAVLRFWLGFAGGSAQWHVLNTQTVVPWLAFAIRWKAENQQLRSLQRISSSQGKWSLPVALESVDGLQVVSHNRFIAVVDLPNGSSTEVVRLVDSGTRAAWWLYLPRISVFIATFFSVFAVWTQFSWLAVGILVGLLWVVIRDFSAKITQKMRVYGF